jgi:diguanylate cyclase
MTNVTPDQTAAGADNRAGTDPLTGLFNRQYLNDALDKDCRRARRYGTPLACMMLDLDGFKELNETIGHSEGDAVLRQVAVVISKSVRDIDTAARYGADKFCILLPETGSEGAMQLAERLRVAISQMVIMSAGHSLSVTASVGVFSPATMNQVRPTTLLDYADTALRNAKLAGKNQVAEYVSPTAGVA